MNKLLSTITSWFNIVQKMTPGGLSKKDEIRQFLAKFGGGKITVTKNNEIGVAFIELDHKEKKNALSGKPSSTLFVSFLRRVFQEK